MAKSRYDSILNFPKKYFYYFDYLIYLELQDNKINLWSYNVTR